MLFIYKQEEIKDNTLNTILGIKEEEKKNILI